MEAHGEFTERAQDQTGNLARVVVVHLRLDGADRSDSRPELTVEVFGRLVVVLVDLNLPLLHCLGKSNGRAF